MNRGRGGDVMPTISTRDKRAASGDGGGGNWEQVEIGGSGRQAHFENAEVGEEKGALEANWSEKWSTFGPRSTSTHRDDYMSEGMHMRTSG